MKAHLSQAALMSNLSYDPETGLFKRLVKVPSRSKNGDIAGSIDKQDGYCRISVCGTIYKAHRLAWLYMTGSWPSGEIDHLDGERSNNKWANLRDVSHRVNANNKRKALPNNKSTGLLGAYKNHNRFASKITVQGRTLHLGNFETAEAAHEAYVVAKRQLHAGCTI